MTKHYFPRNKWLDVRVCADGLGIHVLKWTWRIMGIVSLSSFGVGFTIFSPYYYRPRVIIYLFWGKLIIEPVAAYIDWPWRRNKP